jgi:superfamily I DNA/RNA helicase
MPPFAPTGIWELVVGPPGTGKTSTLLSHLDRELGAGIEAEEIAYVSFTRAARIEAATRAAKTLNCGPDDFVWCRTIHSTAFRLLGLRPEEVLNSKDLKDFAEAYAYDFQGAQLQDEDGDPTAPQIATEDDRLFAALGWARARMLPQEEGARGGPYRVAADQYTLFLERYRKFKEEKRRLDFYDMLEECLASGRRPPVSRAIIDEAQDLSPLQVELVQRWFADCEKVYVAGDDDQAIYGFSGADSRWVMELSSQFPTQILKKSYRVPRLAHEVARLIIEQNTRRVAKQYMPREAEGEMAVLRREEIVDLINEDEETFILGRHWRGVRRFAQMLRERGIAFTVERYPNLSPLGATKAIRAYRAARALQLGRTIPGSTYVAMLSQIPSGKHGGNLLPRGAKKQAKERQSDTVSMDALRFQGLQRLVDELLRVGPRVLSRISSDLLAAFDALERRYGRLPLRPHVTAMSMHASKGREADTVIVLPELSRAAYHDYMLGGSRSFESENRVAYVAVTRTRNRMLFAQRESRRSYPYGEYAKQVLPRPLEERGEDDWWFG